MDADAIYRIEAFEVHDVLARLAFDPRKRRLASELPDDVAHAVCSRMKRDRWHHCTEREQHQAPAAPAQIGIERERTCHDGGCDHAAGRVADQHQLVSIVCRSRYDQTARAGLDGVIEPGRLAATEASQGCPAAGDLADVPAVRAEP